MVGEFPGNSQRKAPVKPEPEKKTPAKNIKSVVSGEVVQRKPSMFRRVKDVFLGDATSVKDYMVLEVFVPAVKDAVVDAVTGGIERMFFGDNVRPGRRGGRGFPGGQHPAMNYAGMSNRNVVVGGPFRDDPRTHGRNARHQFDEVVFPSRADAEAVLRGMFELMDQFEQVTVSDFLELSGISGNNYMDNKFGWYDIRNVGVHRDRGNYIITLPPPEPID